MSACGQCGTIFTSVPEGDANVASIYNHYYDRANFELHPTVEDSLERLVASFGQYRNSGRLLDIGYGEGGLLTIAGRHGWQCYGTEISPSALEYGKQRGWTVTAEPRTDPRIPKAGFDCITMIEFIEHVSDPGQFLLDAARLLRPGGLLYITTPNAKSINRRVLGLQWSVFSPPEHVTIWTARGLGHALAQAGFRTHRVRTDGLNPCEVIARLRPRDQPQAVSRNQSGLALNSAFSSSPARRALKTSINHCLTALRIGDSLKVWAIKNGGAHQRV